LHTGLRLHPLPSENPVTRFLAVAAVLLAASSTVGCSTAQVRVDPSLAGTTPYAVSGANPRRWDAPLGFGAWRTGPVRDGGTLGWSVTVLFGAGVASAHRPYAWTATGPGGALEAECHARDLELFAANGVTFDVGGASGKPALACAFRAPAPRPARDARGETLRQVQDGRGEDIWTLALRATGKPTAAYAGELRGAHGTFAIRAVHALEGSPIALGTPAGYALEREGRVVATVETMNAGRVWLPAASEDADALAAAALALLLFQPDAG
jgi:hypothetical protein